MASEMPDTSAFGMVTKALSILSELLAEGDTKSLADVSRELRIPLSTAHRLTKELERNGFLIRAARGQFVPGMALLHLGKKHCLQDVLTSVGRPFLSTLARQTGHAAHLGILEGDMVTYLVKEAPPNSNLFTREAMQLEAYCSGIGKVLLAALPADDSDAYLGSGPFVSLTANTITEVGSLQAELADVRMRGYAIDDGEIADGLRCVAFPLRNEGTVIAALSLSCAAEALEPPFVECALAALRSCAEGIEAKLGARSSMVFPPPG
jgi:IclR family acetate operon transcriptional repressor